MIQFILGRKYKYGKRKVKLVGRNSGEYIFQFSDGRLMFLESYELNLIKEV